MTLRRLAPYGAIVLVAVLLDQLVKGVVETHMALYERIELLPFLSLLHSRNTGVAFSMFSGIDSAWLSLAVVAVIAFIVIVAIRTDATQRFARLGFALIVGGAVGNLIDRVVHGYVIDYVYFHTPVWSFAVFNLADVFITLGAGLVVLQELIVWRRGRTSPK